MWALRRASNPLKNRGFSSRSSRAWWAKSEVTNCYLDYKVSNDDSPLVISDGSMSLKRFYSTVNGSPNFLMPRYGFSSQVDTKTSAQEDDLEDGFSELETPSSSVLQNSEVDIENEEELISEPEITEEEDDGDGAEEPQNKLELSDNEPDVTKRRSQRKGAYSALFKAILAAPGSSVHSTLDRWIEEGNDLSRLDASLALLKFRKSRMYGRALQFSEWLESTKLFDFVERDYASRLDLIAKVLGLYKAENYIEKIPKSFRGEVIYRTLLANCVAANHVKKAEEVFNKMKDLEFQLTSFACNQLLLLYKRHDKKKIADVLSLMEKENVKPSLFTYRILLDAKGQSNDITGMEQIFEAMKAEGIEPDFHTQALLVRYYVYGGLKEKAEAILKDMEGGNIKENRGSCHVLLPLYASLGKADDVRRIWNACESNPKLEDCMAAIDAWGKLRKTEEAEAIFETMLKSWKKLPSKSYAMLLTIYANNKMLAKGKDLVKQMGLSGCRIGPLTWDALVKLYVEAGQVEKADSILQKATQQGKMKPIFTSYMTIMDQYVKRGDVHNSEKMFHRMRQVGYVARIWQYQALLQAYINANAPAYGMRGRMKADNIFPNRLVAEQLGRVDAFRRTPATDLLD